LHALVHWCGEPAIDATLVIFDEAAFHDLMTASTQDRLDKTVRFLAKRGWRALEALKHR
jgi:hypothetical protein